MSNETLDFSGAKTPEPSKYLNPGVHAVKVTKVEAGKSATKQSPYVEITVQNATGQACSQQYYLNGGAFNISRDNIVQLITAVTGSTDDAAKSKLVGVTTDNIASKLAPLLVGPAFGIVIGGEWVHPTDTSKKPWVKGQFANYKFAAPLNKMGELKFDPSKNIKGIGPVNNTDNATGNAVPKAQNNW